MRRWGIAAGAVVLILAVSAAVVFYVVPRSIRSEMIREQVLSPLEASLHGSFSYESVSFRYFPIFQVQFSGVTLQLKGRRPVDLKAKNVTLEPDAFPLIIRKFFIRQIHVSDGDLQIQMADRDPFEKAVFKNLSLDLKPLGTLKMMQMEFHADLPGAASGISGQFDIRMDSLAGWNWDKAALRGILQLDVKDLPAWSESVKIRTAVRIREGALRGTVHFEKEKGAGWMNVGGAAKLDGIVYELEQKGQMMVSKPLVMGIEFQEVLDFTKKEWSLKRSFLDLPFGRIELNGQGKLGQQEVQDFRISAPEITLEEIPNYLLGIRDGLPLNTGFSGSGRLEISLKGAWQQMAVFSSLDLKEAVITYGSLFDKPKGIPLRFSMEVQLKDGRQADGDISIHFHELLAKGTVKGLDLETGSGQINLLTNRHAAASWGPVIPALKGYELGGHLKILANWQGDLRDIPGLKKILNVRIEKGSIAKTGEPGLKKINLELDYDPKMGLVMQNGSLEAGGQPIKGTLSIYSPEQKPDAKLALESAKINLPAAVKALEPFAQKFAPPLEPFFKTLGSAVPKDLALNGENFVLEAAYNEHHWKIERAAMDAGGGKISAQGDIRLSEKAPAYQLSFDLNGVDVEKLFTAEESGAFPVSGKLFAEAALTGSFNDQEALFASAAGTGKFVLTQAEFKTVDLWQALAETKEFESLSVLAKGQSRFDEVRGHLNFEPGKISSEDLELYSSDWSLNAKGDVSLEGVLNLRLEVYLAYVHAEKILAALSPGAGEGHDSEWFGPASLLASGALDKITVKADPALTAKLVSELKAGKGQRVFRRFLREDALFK